jgi:hypothetical protein
MTEKLRSKVNGKVREAIQGSIGQILVGGDGSITVEANPDGLLGVEGASASLGRWESGPRMERTIRSVTGRQWKVIGID